LLEKQNLKTIHLLVLLPIYSDVDAYLRIKQVLDENRTIDDIHAVVDSLQVKDVPRIPTKRDLPHQCSYLNNITNKKSVVKRILYCAIFTFLIFVPLASFSFFSPVIRPDQAGISVSFSPDNSNTNDTLFINEILRNDIGESGMANETDNQSSLSDNLLINDDEVTLGVQQSTNENRTDDFNTDKIPSGDQNNYVSATTYCAYNDSAGVNSPVAWSITETALDNYHKEVVVSSDSHQTNVIAFATIENQPNDTIHLFHVINGSKKELQFTSFDLDNDSLVDRIEWTVPHLSEQIYEIIIDIIKAQHLDTNRGFLSDIYDQVQSWDHHWSEPIYNGEYVRVTFEEAIGNTNDITVVARSRGTSRIEVYTKDSESLITTFEDITQERQYQIFLTNLSGHHTTFDLRTSGDAIEYDYIVDPTGWISPTGAADPSSQWSSETKSYDDNTGSYAVHGGGTGWRGFLELTLSSAIYCDRVRVLSDFGYGYVDLVDIDIYNSTGWIDKFNGTIIDCTWTELEFSGETNVTKARFRYHYVSGSVQFYFYEFDFYQGKPHTLPNGSTLNATSIDETTAILNGNVTDDGGEPCEFRFQYGSNTSYGINTTWGGSKAQNSTFSTMIHNLVLGNTYQYRVQIRNDIGTINGSNKNFTTAVPSFGWVTPTSHYDPNSHWDNEINTYDDDYTDTYAQSLHQINDPDGLWSFYIYVNHSLIVCDKVRFYARGPTGDATQVDQIDLDVKRGGVWVNVYEGTFSDRQWAQKSFMQGSVDQARMRFHINAANGGLYYQLYEFDFNKSRPVPMLINEGPTNRSWGTALRPQMNITVNNPDGASMTINWSSNSSGSWQRFGTNGSIGNGTYHQINNNFSSNNTKYWWKISVTDGTDSNSSLYYFSTPDYLKPSSNVNAITSYWKKTSPSTITATATDTGWSGLKNVTLYYRFSTNNISWGGWKMVSVDATPPWSWSFAFSNGSGYYQFYSIAKDNATNVETTPGSADAWCGYDATAPSSTVNLITSYWKKTNITVTASASDAMSGVKNVTLYYRFSSNNASWEGWVSAGVDSVSPWSWSFSFSNGSGYYQFYSIAKDNATNVESAPGSADTRCGYDSQASTSLVNTITGYWKNTSPLIITASANDTGTSGLKNVTLYYRYRTTNISSWGGNVSFNIDSDPWISCTWSFTFTNGTGHYQFYSIAKDNASNIEFSPGNADTLCGYDTVSPSSSVDTISPYWKTISPSAITATANDIPSGVKNVTLFYRFSTNNASWSGWVNGGSDTASPWSWSVSFSNGSGYYQFYCIAKDNATNTETIPGGPDAWCGYDDTAPSSSVNPISSYWKTINSLTITATGNDTLSGMKNMTLYYRFSSNNVSWNGWMNAGVDTTLPWLWNFSFSNGSGYYQFYSIAKDNATNIESVPGFADAICGYDMTPPNSSIDVVSPYWKKTDPLAIIATVNDSLSGVKNVALYYRFSSNNASWSGYVSVGVDAASPWNWSFSFTNGSGYYQFYTIAEDNATNIELVPGNADTQYGYDAMAPGSVVDVILTYWKKTSPLTITSNASDATSGVKNVTLYYRYSSNNASWGGWVDGGVETTSPWSWSFSFSNGTGYYQFYSIAKDNATNEESAPGGADQWCGYDNQVPSSSVTTIPGYWKTSSTLVITAVGSDAGPSGLKNVTLYYGFRATNASAWGSNNSFGVDTNPWGTCSWNFSFPSGPGHYRFYSIARDNATNTEASPGGNGDTTCGFNTNAPISVVNEITPYWTSTTPLEIDAIAEDVGPSGLKNVTLYYYNSSDNNTWTGPWQYGIDYDPWVNCSWSFLFSNQTRYYRFYSRATDNSSNVEDAPLINDTECGYDAQSPICNISYNQTASSLKASDSLTIYANFTEPYSGVNESSVLIAISTMGNGSLPNTSMNMIDNIHWYYNWTIPSGSDEDGLFIVKIYATDNVSNNLLPYPTIDASKSIDNTPPVISNLSVDDISSSSVHISWVTSENASSHVEYGPTPSYGYWVHNSAYVMVHHCILSGLSSDTTYYYHVFSFDSTGNQATSFSETFTTLKEIIIRHVTQTKENTPPSKPIINGPTTGHISQSYAFTVNSHDTDNDSLYYLLNWGDGTSESSGLLPQGTQYTINHSWTNAGKYTIKVTASDNKISSSSEKTIWIDAVVVGDIGFILDVDNNGIFDVFHSNSTGRETPTEMKNGIYLLDVDGDGQWDYEFNFSSGLLSLISQQPVVPEKPSFPLLWVGGLIFAIVTAIVILFYRRRPPQTKTT
jgi:hypothetical protein